MELKVRQTALATSRPSHTSRPHAGLGKKLGTAVLNFCSTLVSAPTSAYHPERYYMRGPGPKWHEKHTHNGESSSSA